ncbi:TRAP transporter solute receptor, TAXI family [Denitrovibrio acetiphilus DSM 12809]|uniref:TRAP transporter solute receptor, TAXI family n=1 Tax=Denitrovibrio acetiphilus (strain DSM 12809 / NBRC 114555 / N2460) TaxID=522772 RepID=D4H7F5_DENA2|nr:TAXI family TRAP transporter solute-binding subunit [Denitrovibrio acetiphilus]ADD67954.1 TRAP transporter solute receptor, TAXI family [Denitrovibrio acetiphilus DSM 12809]
MKKLIITLAAVFAVTAVLVAFPASSEAKVYKFSGGPSGGTFQYFASGISQWTNDKKLLDKDKVNVSASAGSTQNVRLISAGRADFGIAYAGDTYLATIGKLSPQDTRKYEGVRAVGYLYGAPAQLIVRADSGINSAADLVGKRVGVGKGGSGAAANAERFFKGMGVWDKMEPQFLGYNNAAAAFSNKQLDAFWVFAGYPTAAVIQAAQQNDIKLINVFTDAETHGVFNEYPFYSSIDIPANTYKGQAEVTKSFQDSALWIASEKVPEDVVYNMIKSVYSKEGLSYLVTIKKTARQMSVEGGTKGTTQLKLHPGAEKFWREMGVIK